MSLTKRVAIDRAGRLVIPKEIREKAGLRPGELLEIKYRNGHVEIEPAPLSVRIEKRGRVAVAVAEEPVPVLTAEDVERIREALRNRYWDG